MLFLFTKEFNGLLIVEAFIFTKDILTPVHRYTYTNVKLKMKTCLGVEELDQSSKHQITMKNYLSRNHTQPDPSYSCSVGENQ